MHQLRFLRKLHKQVSNIQQGKIIWCSDFNISPDPTLDSSFQPKRCKPALGPLLIIFHLHDAWRCHHVEERDYMFFLPCHNSYSRIDLILVDQWILQKVSDSSILPITWSDHSPICITTEDCPSPPRPIYGE